MIIFREPRADEVNFILQEGYKEWSKGRTFEQYCMDNRKEDQYGTRYVIDVNGEIVSSLILLKLKDINGKKVFGIGSVVTSRNHKGKGYASKLINSSLQQIKNDDSIIFLHSEINPEFYEKFGFKSLPQNLQEREKSICMVKCKSETFDEIIKDLPHKIPEYF